MLETAIRNHLISREACANSFWSISGKKQICFFIHLSSWIVILMLFIPVYSINIFMFFYHYVMLICYFSDQSQLCSLIVFLLTITYYVELLFSYLHTLIALNSYIVMFENGGKSWWKEKMLRNCIQNKTVDWINY